MKNLSSNDTLRAQVVMLNISHLESNVYRCLLLWEAWLVMTSTLEYGQRAKFCPQVSGVIKCCGHMNNSINQYLLQQIQKVFFYCCQPYFLMKANKWMTGNLDGEKLYTRWRTFQTVELLSAHTIMNVTW